jgi:inhibitor of KinA sporulation pathway (predicted exonuclease)
MSHQFQKKQPFDYYLILDFEATCDENKRFTNEIIEFPIILLDANSLKIISEFHKYVKPTLNPKLTEFCMKFTGIQQEMVDRGDVLKNTLYMVHQWMQQNGLISKEEILRLDSEWKMSYLKKFAFVTCGDWDLKVMLPKQCKRENIVVPPYYKKFVNIKHIFTDFMHKKAFGMTLMLQELNLKLEGKHHSGIDDARNITKIVVELIKRGAVLNITRDLTIPQIDEDLQQLKWVDVENGKLGLGSRPSKEMLKGLKAQKCDLVGT